MEVLIILIWLCAAAAELPNDLTHLKEFIEQTHFSLKKKYRPLYHVSSPVGWLNNPSGFVFFKRQYHVFYQYHLYKGAWGAIHWGHAVSDNLVDWVHYPPTLIPNDFYDRHGCLSGSAVVHNGYLALFYTGHVLSKNSTYQTQNVAISSDGIVFQKYLYNPIIRKPSFEITDFRNPKVWKFRNTWYMILGTVHEGSPVLLLYTSPDLFIWKLDSILVHSYKDMGYMWENPDFFEVDGQYVLILSVQGIRPDAHRFRNFYQTGYIVGSFNYGTTEFEDLEISTATFNELDYGHDFYGAKTMQALDGRRLLVAWLGTWDSDFKESKDGWASMLTIIREVRISFHGRLLMKPIKELAELRTEALESAWYSPGEAFQAETRSFEMLVNSTSVSHDAVLIFEWGRGTNIRRYTIEYSSELGSVSVDRGGINGVRRADWSPVHKIFWHIFVDSSSIEVFCGEGEVVFSSRIYPKSIRVKIAGEMELHITQYKLRRSVGYDEKLRQYLKSNYINKYVNY
ncbi:sucrose-6-phosphate hydrolase-like [Galleria mellonella]|uniref:Sucrose-6-phosphate hydrolase n=1 Tax=Galleria mellonella TaxID=7137 RepID=A0ABM3N7F3_GALME|nr:sucrose-6-phosphate hydrolase-like [Galleria mellonella]